MRTLEEGSTVEPRLTRKIRINKNSLILVSMQNRLNRFYLSPQYIKPQNHDHGVLINQIKFLWPHPARLENHEFLISIAFIQLGHLEACL